MKLRIRDLKQYREQRKQVREALSLDNTSFW